ncbi:KinB-signaling pathway activation protein [Paenibacillus crassostreae]|uniref:KinB signaling pathway activation protein n=1 Tax=Paenibacillus crassostreae TaxID=1763538 RepID=A0A167E823_9BACL|nr:KinB-signaling pathway activation protein [Paenibacillus crassostreae]AOZ93394.1 KinB signaling pathway activation protein [Paenibacillus crassostreae]OAB75256.1 KinB signaling pathway activation protein [Paenibacillus crassostreae]
MTLRKWFKLFWQALLVGAVVSVATGIVLSFEDGGISFNGFSDYVVYFVILFGYGVLASVYSQLGFFAYLILNYMGNGVFSKKGWQYIQMVLTVLALLELMFFRTFVGGQAGQSSDLILSIVILVVAIITALYKARMTNISAWIPTLFFMIGVTIIEIVGGLKINVDNATAFIVIPLLACNAFQILILHRVVQTEKS